MTWYNCLMRLHIFYMADYEHATREAGSVPSELSSISSSEFAPFLILRFVTYLDRLRVR